MANWNIYIPQKYEAGLQALAIEGESIGQVIKRLVLGLLDGEKPQIAAPSSDALEEIRDRLDALEESQGSLDPDDLERLGKIISDQLGLKEIRDRLSALENKMSDRPTLPKKEIHQGLTHKEIAAMIGSSERTMQRVAKEKERWPEGYLWSEESKKWFLLEG